MANLTLDQLDKATDAYLDGREKTNSVSHGLRCAAPFLQMPWDDISMDEANMIESRLNRAAPPADQLMHAISIFISRRNGALLPKPAIGVAAQGIIDRTRGVTFTAQEFESMVEALRSTTHGAKLESSDWVRSVLPMDAKDFGMGEEETEIIRNTGRTK